MFVPGVWERAPNILSWPGKRKKCRRGSYHIISHHISWLSHILLHVTSYCTWHHVIVHFTSHHIISHIILHIMSDHISYHIISYHSFWTWSMFLVISIIPHHQRWNLAWRLLQVPPPRSHRPNHHQSNRQRWYHRYHRTRGDIRGAPRHLMLKGFQSELVAKRFRSLVQLYSGRCFFLILVFCHGVLSKLNILQYVFGGVIITN